MDGADMGEILGGWWKAWMEIGVVGDGQMEVHLTHLRPITNLTHTDVIMEKRNKMVLPSNAQVLEITTSRNGKHS